MKTLPFTLLVLLAAPGARAAQLPTPFRESAAVTGLDAPTGLAFGPAGDVWIGGKQGQLWHAAPRASARLVATLDVASDGERGIGGLAVDPDFAENGWLWVYYTAASAPARNRLARLSIADGRVAEEQVVLEGPELRNNYHNGGCLRFGEGGVLFLAMGDDGQETTKPQDRFDLRGKVLRLTRDGAPAPGNPYRGTGDGDPRVWASGFRNPWRCDVQPASGMLFVGDVGNDRYEEIDVLSTPGGNFGWPAVEGPEPPGQAGYVYPIFWYPHDAGGPSAVTGGAHARPSDLNGAYTGQYFFGDSSAGRLYRMVLDEDNRPLWTEVFATGVPAPVDIQFGPDGALYYLSFSEGELRRVALDGLAPGAAQ